MDIINKNKICFYTGSLAQGGVERDISFLSNELIKLGYDIYIVTVFSDKIFFKINEKVNIIDISSEIKNRKFSSIYKLKKKIRQLNNEYQFDFVVCNMIGLNCLITKALKNTSCKIVLRIASDPKSWKLRNKILSNIYYPKVYKIVGQTHYQLKCFGKKILKNGVVIPNICDYLYSFNYEELRKSTRIVFIGRLNYDVKRLDILIESFGDLLKKAPNYTLHFIGSFIDENSKNKTEHKIASLNLNDKVFLDGPSSKIHDVLCNSFCYIFASEHEGMPNSILEAQTCGVPVISSDFAGVEEIIENRKNGLIYSFGDSKSLANSILDLINDKNLYKEISSNGIAQKHRYSTDFVMKEWKNVFEN